MLLFPSIPMYYLLLQTISSNHLFWRISSSSIPILFLISIFIHIFCKTHSCLIHDILSNLQYSTTFRMRPPIFHPSVSFALSVNSFGFGFGLRLCSLVWGTEHVRKARVNCQNNCGLSRIWSRSHGFEMCLKARSHCSDYENDNDNDAKRTHSIGWMSVCVFRVEQFNQYNAFSLRRDRYRSCYRCSVTRPLSPFFWSI